MKHRLTVIGVLFVLAGCLCGCNRFTRQRYETLYIGQPTWDVQRRLGKPTRRDGNAWVYVHQATPYYRAIVRFRDGKVVAKEWSYDRPATSQPAGQ